jgi:hypothetical protein
MAEPLTWIDAGGERRLFLDPPGGPGGRYLAVRRVSGDEDWTAACVLVAGEPEREIGDQLASAGIAEDVILKYAIQALARLHDVSPVPGMPEEDAGEAELLIARLWQAITARWAPRPGAGGDPQP